MKKLGMALVLGAGLVFGGCAVNTSASDTGPARSTKSADSEDAVATGAAMPSQAPAPDSFQFTGVWVPESGSSSENSFVIYPDGTCIFAGLDCQLEVARTSAMPDQEKPWTISFHVLNDVVEFSVVVAEDGYLVMTDPKGETAEYTGFERASESTSTLSDSTKGYEGSGIVGTK